MMFSDYREERESKKFRAGYIMGVLWPLTIPLKVVLLIVGLDLEDLV